MPTLKTFKKIKGKRSLAKKTMVSMNGKVFINNGINRSRLFDSSMLETALIFLSINKKIKGRKAVLIITQTNINNLYVKGKKEMCEFEFNRIR